VTKLPDLRVMGGCAPPMIHGVRRSDLDMNDHVNNVVYMELLMEAVPDAVRDAFELAELELEFRGECKYGDVISVACCREFGASGGGGGAGGGEDAAAAAAAAAGVDSAVQGSPMEADGKVRLVHMLLKEGVEARASEVVRARTVWTPKTSTAAADWEHALAAFECCVPDAAQ